MTKSPIRHKLYRALLTDHVIRYNLFQISYQTGDRIITTIANTREVIKSERNSDAVEVRAARCSRAAS